MVTDVIPLLLHVVRILDGLGVPYVVGGSLASGMHGELRATNDIDMLIELPAGKIHAFVDALQPSFDIWEDTVRAAIEGGHSFGALHIDWHIKVDFFPAGESALDADQMARRRAIRLPAAPVQDVWFTSPEDTILRKLDWFRRSGEVLERQLRDVVGVLKLQQDVMDLAYLSQRAHDYGLATLLERCLEDAGHAP